MSPPLRIKPSPPLGLVDAQLPVQFGIPGRCAHGVLSDVPLFESEPAALDTKKQLLIPKLDRVTNLPDER